MHERYFPALNWPAILTLELRTPSDRKDFW